MCGIFGLLTSDKSIYKQEFLSNSFIQLASLSETRGKDSSGICTLNQNINTINILKGPISVQKMKNSNKSYSRILLIPNTHIINLWHLMHHIFIAYKFIKKNNYTSDIVYPVFFKNFHHRQGDVTKCRYNELIFKGLNLDFSTFTEMNE